VTEATGVMDEDELDEMDDDLVDDLVSKIVTLGKRSLRILKPEPASLSVSVSGVSVPTFSSPIPDDLLSSKPFRTSTLRS